MNKYAIFSDSACDLTADLIKKHNITIVPFKISFDMKNKLTEGIDINNDQFYPKLETSGIMPKTYFPTVKNYVDAFKPSLEAGKDILCICLSSKLSKSYVSAVNAGKILSYIYKNNKVIVLDSLFASGGQGLIVLDAVKMCGSLDVVEAYNTLENIKKSGLSILTISSLEQLSKGGRISASAATIGQLLKLNPIIYLENGVLATKGKIIGRQKALNEIIKRSIEEMSGKPENYDLCILHSRKHSEAMALGESLKNEYGIQQTIKPLELGLTIGMHTGASVVATVFVKKIPF